MALLWCLGITHRKSKAFNCGTIAKFISVLASYENLSFLPFFLDENVCTTSIYFLCKHYSKHIVNIMNLPSLFFGLSA